MSADESAGAVDPAGESTPALVDSAPRRETPIAPADPDGAALADDLRSRVAELDAIAWNLPSRGDDLLLPPDAAWPV